MHRAAQAVDAGIPDGPGKKGVYVFDLLKAVLLAKNPFGHILHHILSLIAPSEDAAGQSEHEVQPFLSEYVSSVKFHFCLYDAQMYKMCHKNS